MAACGLDFGTSNTTLGHNGAAGPVLLPLEGEHLTIPSAIFFEPRRDPLVGRAATAAYVAGRPGRLMRGLKSVLGTPLIDEATPVGRERLRLRDVIARYLAIVKARAEEAAGTTFDTVVHGRPVHFVDGDVEADRRAEDTLRAIAADVGFRHVTFQYEPIAAALDYERQVEREEIADILANDGVRIGGTDFDRQLSLAAVMPLLGFGSAMKRGDLAVPGAYYHDLATWSAINRLYDGKTLREIDDVLRNCARPDLVGRLRTAVEEERGHALAGIVEGAKITASETGAASIDLASIERGLVAALDRAGLAAKTDGLARAVAARVDACLTRAGLPAGRIDALFLTGGSTGLPHLRAALAASVPDARIIAGDTFGSVGLGLTVAAGTLSAPAGA